MAARGGARLQLQLLDYGVWLKFSKEFIVLGDKMELGFGWLRAVAQGYIYSYNKNELMSSFQKNLMSWGVQSGWGFGGGARSHKVTIKVNVKWNWKVIFKII